jgi:hypothetical protein
MCNVFAARFEPSSTTSDARVKLERLRQMSQTGVRTGRITKAPMATAVKLANFTIVAKNDDAPLRRRAVATADTGGNLLRMAIKNTGVAKTSTTRPTRITVRNERVTAASLMNITDDTDMEVDSVWYKYIYFYKFITNLQPSLPPKRQQLSANLQQRMMKNKPSVPTKITVLITSLAESVNDEDVKVKQF